MDASNSRAISNFENETVADASLLNLESGNFNVKLLSDLTDCPLNAAPQKERTVEFVLSQHGHPKLVYDKFLYCLEKAGKGLESNTTWRCERRKDKCKARLHTNSKHKVADKSIPTDHQAMHNHPPPEPELFEIHRSMNRMKELALNTTVEPGDIVDVVMNSIPENVRSRMSKRESLRRIIERTRQTKSNKCQNSTLSLVEVNGTDGDMFLLRDPIDILMQLKERATVGKPKRDEYPPYTPNGISLVDGPSLACKIDAVSDADDSNISSLNPGADESVLSNGTDDAPSTSDSVLNAVDVVQKGDVVLDEANESLSKVGGIDFEKLNPEFVATQRGMPKMILGGYAYRLNRIQFGRISWVCECDKRGGIIGCHARCMMNDELKILKLDFSEHIHPPDFVRMNLIRLQNKIWTLTQTTDFPLVQIVDAAVAEMSEEVRARLPRKASIIRAMQRRRATNKKIPQHGAFRSAEEQLSALVKGGGNQSFSSHEDSTSASSPPSEASASTPGEMQPSTSQFGASGLFDDLFVNLLNDLNDGNKASASTGLGVTEEAIKSAQKLLEAQPNALAMLGLTPDVSGVLTSFDPSIIDSSTAAPPSLIPTSVENFPTNTSTFMDTIAAVSAASTAVSEPNIGEDPLAATYSAILDGARKRKHNSPMRLSDVKTDPCEDRVKLLRTDAEHSASVVEPDVQNNSEEVKESGFSDREVLASSVDMLDQDKSGGDKVTNVDSCTPVNDTASEGTCQSTSSKSSTAMSNVVDDVLTRLKTEPGTSVCNDPAVSASPKVVTRSVTGVAKKSSSRATEAAASSSSASYSPNKAAVLQIVAYYEKFFDKINPEQLKQFFEDQIHEKPQNPASELSTSRKTGVTGHGQVTCRRIPSRTKAERKVVTPEMALPISCTSLVSPTDFNKNHNIPVNAESAKKEEATEPGNSSNPENIYLSASINIHPSAVSMVNSNPALAIPNSLHVGSPKPILPSHVTAISVSDSRFESGITAGSVIGNHQLTPPDMISVQQTMAPTAHLSLPQYRQPTASPGSFSVNNNLVQHQSQLNGPPTVANAMHAQSQNVILNFDGTFTSGGSAATADSHVYQHQGANNYMPRFNSSHTRSFGPNSSSNAHFFRPQHVSNSYNGLQN